MRNISLKRRSKIIESKKIKIKLILVCFLIFIFVLDLIYVSFFQRKYILGGREFNTLNMMEEDKYNIEKNELEEWRKSEKDFSNLKITIKNLEEQAVPILGDKAKLLEEGLEKYLRSEDLNVTQASIFHTTIVQNEEMKLCFFCELDGATDIIQLNYSYEKETVDVEKSNLTKEEIVNEIWNGISPSIRDIQE